MKTITFIFTFFVLIGFACSTPSKEDKNQTDTAKQAITDTNPSPDTSTFAGKLEQAHHKNDFLSKEAIAFDIVLSFGGQEVLNAKMTLLTNSTKGLMELKDGNKIFYEGSKVFHSPQMKNTKGVRFSAFTWSYFFLFPYKLTDPGTQWLEYENDSLNGKTYLSEKLTFGEGIGDSPEDWYIVYANPETQLIEVASYIVTLNKSKEEAEEDPHAIQYHNYKTIEGVPFATEWTFWEWSADKGLGKQLGAATLSNISFQNVEEKTFMPPADFVEAE